MLSVRVRPPLPAPHAGAGRAHSEKERASEADPEILRGGVLRAAQGGLATAQQVRVLTALVFAASLVVGFYIAFWDLLFTEILKLINPA